jgi:EAL domain-containing protein (putative c-di-GMP-specific phosphodiesterase class I)
MTPEVASEALSNDRRGPVAIPSLLEAAIERGGLHPFFHARVSMATGKISGFEALARIGVPQSSGKENLAGPGPYIDLAERSQRIDALTFAMARSVAKIVTDFNTVRDLPCSINISRASLENPQFASDLAVVIMVAGLDCNQFTLEVTETKPADYGPRAFETMTALRAKGFGIAIDDFGAGASNIDRLRMFPFTEMKIDPAFTRLAMEEAFAKAAMVSCVKVAKDVGLRVVAEGVETQEMWDFMKWAGVDDAQGFLLSRPLPPAEFRALLQAG